MHDHAVEQEDPEAVAQAMEEEPDEARWCTDSQEVQEEPNQKR